ncbi:MAG: GNAT family N-acetyltransferase [Xenococcaceae cyanobacterium MO_167.B27]|nr:GNAT family N-acetyltransferase [Xenococcaceae cyanobacterium MO_167.B27]
MSGSSPYITDEVWELGGIYVLPKFRGQSVAREIVKHLLLQAENVHLYCIPFTNLGLFYKEMGFVECSNSSKIPEKIREKYRWCQQTYPQGVLLLERLALQHN